MKILRTALKSLAHRPLNTFLSVLLLSFGLGLIMVLLTASANFENAFTRNIRGLDLVVGAKGSPLQLILSGVYHLDAPTGNIPLAEYQKLARNPMVKKAIPLSLGDNYAGYRIVGSDTSYAAHYGAQLAQGQNFEQPLQVCLGAKVAQNTGLQIGDSFEGTHGLQAEGTEDHHHAPFVVTGIFALTGTVIDQLIITPLASVWAVHEHPGEAEKHPQHEETEHHHDEEHHHAHQGVAAEEEREITVGLFQFKNPMGAMRLPRMINENTPMQAALPAIEVNRLFTLAESAVKFLQALALLLVFLAAISVFTALLQSLRDEEAQLAFLRAIGSPRGSILGLVLSKGLVLSLLGYFFALLFSQVALWGISYGISESYHYDMEQSLWQWHMLWLLIGVLALGFIAALLPALRAYRLNISKTLADA